MIAVLPLYNDKAVPIPTRMANDMYVECIPDMKEGITPSVACLVTADRSGGCP